MFLSRPPSVTKTLRPSFGGKASEGSISIAGDSSDHAGGSSEKPNQCSPAPNLRRGPVLCFDGFGCTRFCLLGCSFGLVFFGCLCSSLPPPPLCFGNAVSLVLGGSAVLPVLRAKGREEHGTPEKVKAGRGNISPIPSEFQVFTNSRADSKSRGAA